MSADDSKKWLPKDDLVGALVDHVVQTLPESCEQRLRVLNGLLVMLPSGHPTYIHLSTLTDNLVKHQLTQREFPFTTRPGGVR